MVKKSRTTGVIADTKTKNDSGLRQPNERDEAPEEHTSPRNKMKQASVDLENGLIDTDMHGQRGIEEVVKDSKTKRR